MRRFLPILLLIYFLITPCSSEALFFKNKDSNQEADCQATEEQNMEEPPIGYRVLGDMSILDKPYPLTKLYFEQIMPFGIESNHSMQQLGESSIEQEKLARAEKVFKKMLMKNKDSVCAKMGLGYVEIQKRNFQEAKNYFNQILVKDPTYSSAKMGVVYSCLGNDEKLRALDELNKIDDKEKKDEVGLTRAQTYYDMEMLSDSKKALSGVVNKDADTLRYKLKRDDAITITPSYSFLIQTLAENFKLNSNKFGINVSKNIDNNLTVFSEYNIYVYGSGLLDFGHLYNVTNELRGGVRGRPKEKVEFRADFGAKIFEFGDGMLITDSWLKYYFNDKFNLKLGVRRNNVEQSYLSAVGFPLDGVFTGRVADNKLYLEYDAKLPKNLYSFGRTGVGLMTGQNLDTNPYAEALVGVGKIIYNNPENKFIKAVNLDVVSYNASYKENLLNIPNAAGEIFGGYFSPSFFTANTVNIKTEGKTKKLRYGLKGFAGCQISMAPNQTSFVWSFSPYVAYDLNDHVTFNAAYVYFNYADVQRNLFMVNAVIRGFKNAKK